MSGEGPTQRPQSTAADTTTRDGLLGPLVGRGAELAVLETLLDRGERLLTIFGPPGIGKTRLARVALARAGSRGARTVFCDLTEARSEDDMAAAVAAAVTTAARARPHDRPEPDAGDLLSALGPAVVVLDNFEQLAERGRPLILRWLGRAPTVALLLTSRELLRVDEERSLELAPLGVPPLGELSSEAVDLFLQAARRSAFEYAPSPAEATAIAEITRRLDGIPLAIELAAARCRVMGPVTLLDRLARPLEVLGGRRAGADREKTLRGAITWSWNLLDGHERHALGQLAVFRGGFDINAAEAVVVLPPEAPTVLDVVHALRDKGLVWSRATGAGETRSGLYLAIRQFAEEKLSEGEGSAEAWARHARHYAHAGSAKRSALDLENVVACAERALAAASDDPAWGAATELALRAATTLALRVGREPGGSTSPHGGSLRSRRALLDAALARRDAPTSSKPEVRAQAFRARARLKTLGGAVVEAAEDCRAALALVTDDASAALRAATLTDLGNAEAYLGRFDTARSHFEDALELFVKAGDRRAEASTLIRAARCAIELRKGDQAENLLARTRVLSRGRGELCACTFFGAVLHHDRCALGPALAAYEEAFVAAREGSDRFYEAASLMAIGMVRLEQARAEEAIDQLTRGEEIAAELDDRLAVLARAYLGAALANTGRLAEAARAFDAAESLFPTMDIDVLRTAATLLRAVLEVKLAAAADEAADPRAAAAFRAQARSRIDDARGPRAGGAAPFERSVDVRIALRIVEASCAAADPASEADGTEIRVHAEGDWFQERGAARAICKGRPALTRLLVALARARIESPGKPVDRSRLVAAAWPGQRLTQTSARNRLHVALSTLRSMGLRDVLLAADDGYLLDARVPLRIIA